MCYLLAVFSTICMCLWYRVCFSVMKFHIIHSIIEGEMTAMTASPIGLYFEKRTRPICVTPSLGRSDAIHFAPCVPLHQIQNKDLTGLRLIDKTLQFHNFLVTHSYELVHMTNIGYSQGSNLSRSRRPGASKNMVRDSRMY